MPTPEDDECRHGMNPSWCSTCKNLAAVRSVRFAPSLTVLARLHSSQFPGDCDQCNLPIYEGSPIAKVTDGSWERWVHAYCAPE